MPLTRHRPAPASRGLAATLALGLLVTGSGSGTAAADPGPTTSPAPPVAFAPPPAAALLEDNGGLGRFFAALEQSERGLFPAGRVAIVQIGDSHTAADFFTSRLRQRLQGQFGDGGRGFMLPGRPFKYYGQRDAEYGSKGRWTLVSGRKLDQGLLEPLGLAGMRVRATSPSAEAFVGTCTHCKAGRRVSRFEIYYRPLPRGGTLEYRVDDGAWKPLATQPARGTADATTGEPPARLGYHEVLVPEGAHRLTVRPAGDGPVEVFGIVSERQSSGVVVDAVGINGARAAHLHGWDFAYVGEQLQRRDPRLIILAYGTNEAADGDKTDVSAVRRQLSEVVRRLQRSLPGAAVLVLGAPDMARAEPAGCGPPRRKRGRKVRKRRVRSYLPCQYRTPALLEQVVAVQRQIARDQGVAFFDSLAALGGKNSMDGLYRQSPPLAGRDRVHYTARGYEVWADRLIDGILARYQIWKRSNLHAMARPLDSRASPSAPGPTLSPPAAPLPLPAPAPQPDPAREPVRAGAQRVDPDPDDGDDD